MLEKIKDKELENYFKNAKLEKERVRIKEKEDEERKKQERKRKEKEEEERQKQERKRKEKEEEEEKQKQERKRKEKEDEKENKKRLNERLKKYENLKIANNNSKSFFSMFSSITNLFMTSKDEDIIKITSCRTILHSFYQFIGLNYDIKNIIFTNILKKFKKEPVKSFIFIEMEEILKVKEKNNFKIDIIINCLEKINDENINKLNGYWDLFNFWVKNDFIHYKLLSNENFLIGVFNNCINSVSYKRDYFLYLQDGYNIAYLLCNSIRIDVLPNLNYNVDFIEEKVIHNEIKFTSIKYSFIKIFS
jgi:flagellar motor protein MotB